jgi:hypothetical protein
VSLDLDFDKAFPSDRVGGYERLLLDAIAGRLNLFVRSDEQEQAWRWVEPVLHAWAADPTGPRPMPPGAGGRPPPARWWRATVAPGPKSNDPGPARVHRADGGVDVLVVRRNGRRGHAERGAGAEPGARPCFAPPTAT